MDIYLKRKRGTYYADDNCGYTQRAELAGHYTKEDAEEDERLSGGEIQAVLVTDVIKNAEYIERQISKLQNVLKALNQ